jgi:hypothetical protein
MWKKQMGIKIKTTEQNTYISQVRKDEAIESCRGETWDGILLPEADLLVTNRGLKPQVTWG